jgi:DNA-binding transcriptional LysR family regulator
MREQSSGSIFREVLCSGVGWAGRERQCNEPTKTPIIAKRNSRDQSVERLTAAVPMKRMELVGNSASTVRLHGDEWWNMVDDRQLIETPLGNPISAVTLQHLRYAVSAADHGSFRRAAEGLLVRQSTLSRCIRQLEHSIGTMVFERSSAGIRTTSSGREFPRTARSILEQIDSLVKSTHHAGRGEAGRLSIGFYTSLSAGNLRATLVDYQRRFFQIDVCLKDNSRTRLVTALRNGALDIAIITGELPLLESHSMALWSERILLALLKEHPLASKDVIYWTDLRDETVLLSQYDPGRELEDLLMSKLVSPEGRPKIARHDVSRSIIKNLIAAGFGVSLVTESDIGANFSGLTYRELRDGTGPSWVGFSAHWRSDNDNPALANFLKLLAERYPLPFDRV